MERGGGKRVFTYVRLADDGRKNENITFANIIIVVVPAAVPPTPPGGVQKKKDVVAGVNVISIICTYTKIYIKMNVYIFI